MAAEQKHDGDTARARILDEARNVLAKCHHMITGAVAASQPVDPTQRSLDQGDRNIVRVVAR